MEAREKYIKKQLFWTIIVFLFLIIIVFILVNSFSRDTKQIITYHESGSVNYKVYLKNNNYFEQSYLEENKTYITSLIDHLNITFNHSLDFDRKINGDYQYSIIAQVEANKANNEPGNYWTKEFAIKEGKKFTLTEQSSYKISENINIDYNKYNILLKDFTKDMGLSNAEGLLKVYLIVNSNIRTGKSTEPLKKELMLKIPLSETAVEASVENPSKEKISQIIVPIDYLSTKNIIKLLSSGVLLIICLILAIRIFRRKKEYENKYKVQNSIRKFLNTYDSIIVNVEAMPNTEGYHEIKVENFNELIDAHSEVRMPINYYHNNDKNVFLLFNENTVWYYVIDEKEENDEK